MWLNKLKIAIVEKDTQNIDKLIDTMPEFSNKDDAQSALYLIKEAAKLMYGLRDETAIKMKKLKKHIEFLDSTNAPIDNSRLDIKS